MLFYVFKKQEIEIVSTTNDENIGNHGYIGYMEEVSTDILIQNIYENI